MPGHTPVPQPELGGFTAHTQLLQPRGNAVKGRFEVTAIKLGRAGQQTPVGKGARFDIGGLATVVADHCGHGQSVFAGEFPVPLIVGGHRHDGTRAVVHEHIVGDPDRDGFTGEGVTGAQPGIHAQLLDLGNIRFRNRHLFTVRYEGRQLWVLCRKGQCDGVFRGQTDVGHSVQGVRSGRVDLDSVQVGDGCLKAEGQLNSVAFTNPVALHGAHRVGPALQGVQSIQEFLGVGGNADEPLGNFPAFNHGSGSPATAVDHLLIGQYGLIHRIPVDGGHFFVHQPLLMEPGEEPLLPLVIAGVTGGQLAVPVIGKAQPAQLLGHMGNVLPGPMGGRYLVGNGGVFCRQTEGIPAHGLQDIFAQHALITGDDIGDGVVAHMPHVQLAAGVGKHGQAVKFFPTAVRGSLVAIVIGPAGLGVELNLLGAVFLVHRGSVWWPGWEINGKVVPGAECTSPSWNWGDQRYLR